MVSVLQDLEEDNNPAHSSCTQQTEFLDTREVDFASLVGLWYILGGFMILAAVTGAPHEASGQVELRPSLRVFHTSKFWTSSYMYSERQMIASILAVMYHLCVVRQAVHVVDCAVCHRKMIGSHGLFSGSDRDLFLGIVSRSTRC